MKQYLQNLALQIIEENDINVPKGTLTEDRITNGMQIFFGIAAAVAVLIIAVSAIKIIISRGNSENVAKARNAIVYASVGLAITMSAFVIVTFVVERI